MTNKYIDLIDQTYYFPQEGFQVIDGNLYFYDVPLMKLVEEYGTPLRLCYLPKISAQIQKSKRLFSEAIRKHDYKGTYRYCFCTKSSHFAFVLHEALENDIHLELSSSFDVDLVRCLYADKRIDKTTFIVCNGFKPREYIYKISQLRNEGFNVLPVIDNMTELNFYSKYIDGVCPLGIRVAAEEEPTFEFYTSRLGIRYQDIFSFYENNLRNNPQFSLKMLHFFINTGIKDETYYWNELSKILRIYCQLSKICPDLSMINIGGGLPIRYSLDPAPDYEYLISEIVYQIKITCEKAEVPCPDIFTEFGNFTVGESGAMIFRVITEKQQNDSEKWYMIDGSMMTTMPDIYGIRQRFILLPVNKWNSEYQRVTIGGLSCDGNDFYSSRVHRNNLYLPQINGDEEPLYLGFFHVGAYQESLTGFGGIKHCLIPSPKYVLVDSDGNGNYSSRLFSDSQNPEHMLQILGY
ncbi:MAG: arginine decarboxylase [Sphingobacteriales bacterium]|nr:arginine decarboxylase [Sphingobacteriales bacterium]